MPAKVAVIGHLCYTYSTSLPFLHSIARSAPACLVCKPLWTLSRMYESSVNHTMEYRHVHRS